MQVFWYEKNLKTINFSGFLGQFQRNLSLNDLFSRKRTKREEESVDQNPNPSHSTYLMKQEPKSHSSHPPETNPFITKGNASRSDPFIIRRASKFKSLKKGGTADRYITSLTESGNSRLDNTDILPSPFPTPPSNRAVLMDPMLDTHKSHHIAYSSLSSPMKSPTGTLSQQHTRNTLDLQRIMSTPTKQGRFPLAIQDTIDLSIYDKTPNRPRVIPTNPYVVLDAPNARDDYYVNVLDWSCHGTLLVGLSNDAYLWTQVE